MEESPPSLDGGAALSPAEEDTQMQDSFFNAAAPSPPNFTTGLTPDMTFAQSPMFDMSTPPFMRELPRPGQRFDPNGVTSSLSSLFDDRNSMLRTPSPRPPFSGQSPRLIDLLLPGSELNARPSSLTTTAMLPTPALTMSPITDEFSLPIEMTRSLSLYDDVEEVIREQQPSEEDLWMSLRGQMPDNSRSSLQSVTQGSPFKYRQPEVLAGSPEMLMLRFDKQTCGILSVKDGPTENPWRTLVWPLARDSTALYHAIASMTAFHTSKQAPSLRVDGMEHMRLSIRSLAGSLNKMRTDTALATTLVLAFSESWDQHISTGIEHLRGAKILVNRALAEHHRHRLRGDDLARLKFLCNTWVYMDVIARLTSIEEESSTDYDHDHVVWPFNDGSNPMSVMQTASEKELDPLMGCAATLFPLIGRAANLCRKVRRALTNSIAIINQATELKEAIERWSAPPSTAFDRPEDPTSEIQHALQTAEAYRFATLLYLHQAVPEIPSPTSAVLAKKVLVFLATVPLSSRLVIVQIYPLLAAGCEAWDEEDRQWVRERWHSMASRMWIGNIDRCQEVMTEVWDRRDASFRAKAEKESQRRSSTATGMVHSESSKRKFEEELALEEGFSFSDMLNSSGNGNGNGAGTVLGSPGKKQRTGLVGSLPFDVVHPPMTMRRRDSITEELDPEMTVRGRLHWVGVMKDWEWESKSISSCLSLSLTLTPSDFFFATFYLYILLPKLPAHPKSKLTQPHSPPRLAHSPSTTPPPASHPPASHSLHPSQGPPPQ